MQGDFPYKKVRQFDLGKTSYSGSDIYEIPLYMAGNLLACLGGMKIEYITILDFM